jgi:uncharacterized protein (DUF1330 family)
MDDTARRARLVIVAILTPRSGSMEIFREYETKAARIVARHGGAIERTVVEEAAQPGSIREVHVVCFPDSAAFANYRADPDLASLAALRDAAIAQTELLFGRDGPDYMSLCGA